MHAFLDILNPTLPFVHVNHSLSLHRSFSHVPVMLLVLWPNEFAQCHLCDFWFWTVQWSLVDPSVEEPKTTTLTPSECVSSQLFIVESLVSVSLFPSHHWLLTDSMQTSAAIVKWLQWLCQAQELAFSNPSCLPVLTAFPHPLLHCGMSTQGPLFPAPESQKPVISTIHYKGKLLLLLLGIAFVSENTHKCLKGSLMPSQFSWSTVVSFSTRAYHLPRYGLLNIYRASMDSVL